MGTKKILIVDFDQNFQRSLASFLRNQGFTILAATDGAEGLNLAKAEKPDLIVTEAMLPKLHGFDLCSEISQNPALKTPVIIVTGVYKDVVYKTEAIRTFGAAAFFEKPIIMNELLVTVNRILGHHSPSDTADDEFDKAILDSLRVKAPSQSRKSAAESAPKTKDPNADIDALLQTTLSEFNFKPERKREPKARPDAAPVSPQPSEAPKTAPAPSSPVPAPKKETASIKAPASEQVPADTQMQTQDAPRPEIPLPEVFRASGESMPSTKRTLSPKGVALIASGIVLVGAVVLLLKSGERPKNDALPVQEETRQEIAAGPEAKAPEPAAPAVEIPEAKERDLSGHADSPVTAPRPKETKAAPPKVRDKTIRPSAAEPMKEAAPVPSSFSDVPAPAPSKTPTSEEVVLPESSTPPPAEIPVMNPASETRAPEIAKAEYGDLVAVEAVDVRPRPIRTQNPVYPNSARVMQKEGTVIIQALISETGGVLETKIVQGVKGFAAFDRAAEEALKRWKFKPAEKEGVKVRVWLGYTFNFKK